MLSRSPCNCNAIVRFTTWIPCCALPFINNVIGLRHFLVSSSGHFSLSESGSLRHTVIRLKLFMSVVMVNGGLELMVSCVASNPCPSKLLPEIHVLLNNTWLVKVRYVLQFVYHLWSSEYILSKRIYEISHPLSCSCRQNPFWRVALLAVAFSSQKLEESAQESAACYCT